MRYYELVLSGSSERIKSGSASGLRWKDFDYESPIAAVNAYMYQNLKNDISFIIYREDEAARLPAVFSFDETQCSFDSVYSYLTEMLTKSFGLGRVMMEPVEVTMYQFLDCTLEARRHTYLKVWSRCYDTARLWLYDYQNRDYDWKDRFTFEERIVSTDDEKKQYLRHPSFLKELKNIESGTADPDISGNVVHYFISGETDEAKLDMAETLAKKLFRANRITSGRMEIISDLKPKMGDESMSMIEQIAENNHGGVVAIDLTERFGEDPVDYGKVCRFLEKLVRRHRQHCLFFFLYTLDRPGFSYMLLPNLKKYLIPVSMREGSGDRAEAEKYLKELIRHSEYSKYANKAKEYMAQYRDETFSQSDVLELFEKFGPWCLSKYAFASCKYRTEDEFLLDRNEEEDPPYEKLQKMIGLKSVKEQIDRILIENSVETERKKYRGRRYEHGSMHMIFAGDPGTAKTTVAKLFAKIAKQKGILKSGAFEERGGMSLCGLGAEIAIREAFQAAKGGVLFIDEAYAMDSPSAAAVLIQEMENHRDEVIVILAGYTEPMRKFLDLNEGLKSRIPYTINFPNYDADELTDIFRLMLKEKGFTATEEAVEEAKYIFNKARYVDSFGNGRYVRNLLDRTIQNQAVRLGKANPDTGKIDKELLFHLEKEDISELNDGLQDVREPGTAMKELEAMIGLAEAKKLLHKAVSYFSVLKQHQQLGIRQDRASMHMVFTGNPGTAKTTAARLFAEIMKDKGILPTGAFVETGRADLVGLAVGHTAPKVRERFREAQGGVLFIDEAYSLSDGYKGSYGDEAINTIVQEMENHREDVVVIFAGYPEPMNEFLERNPGMASRIAFRVNFSDYTPEELCQITELMAVKNHMKVTEAAMEKLRGIYETQCHVESYGNGRFVRKILEEAGMNLAVRLSGLNPDDITREMYTTIEACDVPDDIPTPGGDKPRMGFTCD